MTVAGLGAFFDDNLAWQKFNSFEQLDNFVLVRGQHSVQPWHTLSQEVRFLKEMLRAEQPLHILHRLVIIEGKNNARGKCVNEAGFPFVSCGLALFQAQDVKVPKNLKSLELGEILSQRYQV
jgi:hypothetical protein